MNISPEMIKGGMSLLQQNDKDSDKKEDKLAMSDIKLNPLSSDPHSVQVRSDRVSHLASNFADVYDQNDLWQKYNNNKNNA